MFRWWNPKQVFACFLPLCNLISCCLKRNDRTCFPQMLLGELKILLNRDMCLQSLQWHALWFLYWALPLFRGVWSWVFQPSAWEQEKTSPEQASVPGASANRVVEPSASPHGPFGLRGLWTHASRLWKALGFQTPLGGRQKRIDSTSFNWKEKLHCAWEAFCPNTLNTRLILLLVQMGRNDIFIA